MTDNDSADGRTLRDRLAAGESPAGSWVSLASPAAAEAVGALDFEFVVVDTEHTSMAVETVENLVRAVDAAGDTDCLVRVPENDRTAVKRALDVGAAGVMAPQVDTAEAARELVASATYPPEGGRGVAGTRATDYGANLESYFASANDEVAVLPQVESEQALENAEAIAAVDGVDALFVGPADLSASLDCFGDYDAPAFREAVDEVLAAGDRAEVPVGTLAVTEDQIADWHERGFDFLIVGTDVGYLQQGAASARRTYEQLR